MSTAAAVCHGQFGRASVYRLTKPLSLHAHREGHLIFKLDGADSTAIVSDHQRTIDGEFAAAVNPWQPHSWAPHGENEESCILVLYVNPLRFLEVGRDAKNALRFGRSSVKMTAQIKELAGMVAALLLEQDEMQDVIESYVYQLTRVCFDQTWQWDGDGEHVPPAYYQERDFRIRKSIKLMVSRLGDELVLDDVARESGLSRPHFFKLFRQHVGITPNLYLNILKTERSVERLTTTNDAVTSIGLDLGFASQASFTRFFSANVGISPTDYRRASMLLGQL